MALGRWHVAAEIGQPGAAGTSRQTGTSRSFNPQTDFATASTLHQVPARVRNKCAGQGWV